MTLPNDVLSNFATVYDVIPEKWDDARAMLTESLRELAENVNTSQKGEYVDQEVLAGKLWTPRARTTLNEPIVYRNVLRKVINVGPLNDFSSSATQSVAHGIDTTEDTFITALYGAATDPGASLMTAAIPLPYVDTSALSACIELRADATNIILVSATDYSAYTSAWVVVEYVQEA